MEKQKPKHWFWSLVRPGLDHLGSTLGRHLGEMGAHAHHLSILGTHSHSHVRSAHAAAMGAIGGPRPVKPMRVQASDEQPEIGL